MSAQSSSARARGFVPRFRAGYSDQYLRVSDAERQEVADRLAEHFADGRLDQAEFDERVAQAMSAKTRADLGGLLADLPETGAPTAPALPRRRRSHPVLLIALVVVIAATVGHAVMWVFWPGLWIALLVAVVLFATGAVGRSRTTHRPE